MNKGGVESEKRIQQRPAELGDVPTEAERIVEASEVSKRIGIPVRISRVKKEKMPKPTDTLDDKLDQIADRLRTSPSDPGPNYDARQATAVICAAEALAHKKPPLHKVIEFTQSVFGNKNHRKVTEGLNVVRGLRKPPGK